MDTSDKSTLITELVEMMTELVKKVRIFYNSEKLKLQKFMTGNYPSKPAKAISSCSKPPSWEPWYGIVMSSTGCHVICLVHKNEEVRGESGLYYCLCVVSQNASEHTLPHPTTGYDIRQESYRKMANLITSNHRQIGVNIIALLNRF